MSHLWLAITLTREAILIFLAEMLPIKSVIKRHFTMPPQVTCTSALPGKQGNIELKCCGSAFPEFNQLLLDFFNLFDLRLMLLYDSLNLVISAFSSGCWGHGSR